MKRVQIKLATDSIYYSFPINPIEFNDNDSLEYSTSRTIDGKSIEQYSFFDGRVKTMTWRNLPNKTPYAGDASSLLNKLRTLVRAGECHLLLNDLDKVGATAARTSIKIIDLTTVLSSSPASDAATGHLKFDTIEIKYVDVIPTS